MHLPLVSFCIPVHNAGAFLADTLESLLVQDYPHIEIICVNDHSTDDSLNILKKFDKKISFFEANNYGASAARNLAFKNSSGEFVVFFDADDLVNPDYVSSQLSKIQDDLSVVICKWGRFHVNADTLEEDQNIIKHDMTLYEWVIKYWTYNLHTTPPGRILIARKTLQAAGLWDEELSLNDDLEFFTRVFYAANKIIYNDETIFKYRSGIIGISSRTKGRKYQLSNWKSFEKATNLALSAYPHDHKIEKACANMWQQFIYENYPNNKDLIRKAEISIQALGGADFSYPSGGLSQKLMKIIGWKATKRLQLFQKSIID